jgi:hypothetical protein
MKNLTIENKGNQMVLRINKKGFDKNYLIALVKRLQIEELAQKADFDTDVLTVADEINQKWWDKNGEQFLKDTGK